MRNAFNIFGDHIAHNAEMLVDQLWVDHIDEKGMPVIDWKNNIQYGDGDGFDTRHPITTHTLKPGEYIVRFGRETGRFTAPLGTSYEELSLPYKIETIEFNVYEVLIPIQVDAKTWKGIPVKKGYVAPGFNQRGGGVQYLHDKQIIRLVKEGYLRRLEVSEWLIRYKEILVQRPRA